MKTIHTSILIGLITGVVFWVLESTLDFLIFYNAAFLDILILDVPLHEVYIRLLALLVCLIFALVIGRYITSINKAKEQMQSLSRHNEAILAAIPDIIMEVDKDKIYTWSNNMGIEFFGQDVLGKDASYYFEGQQKTYEVVQPLFEGDDSVFYVESWQRRKDGQKRLLAWWCRAIKDPQGNVKGALSTARDITQQKGIEQELRNSVELISEAERLANIGYYELNWRTGKAFWSPGFYLLIGYRPGQIPPTYDSFLSLIHQSDRKAFNQALEQSLLSKGPYEHEFRIVRQDGHTCSVRAIGRFTYGKDGRPVTCLAMCQDVTQRKTARKALQQSNDMLLRAQQLAKMGFIDWNLKTDQMHWSRQVFWLYGIDWKLKPTLELSMDLVHPDDRQAVRKATNLAIKGLKRYDIQYRRLQPKGKLIWVHDRGELIRDENGAPDKILISVLDITRWKQAQEKMQSLARFPSENPSPVLRVARDGTLLYANHASTDLLSQWNSKVGAAVPEHCRRLVSQALESGSSIFQKCRVQDREYCFQIVPIIQADYVNLYGMDADKPPQGTE